MAVDTLKKEAVICIYGFGIVSIVKKKKQEHICDDYASIKSVK